jgi:hypothetical protein
MLLSDDFLRRASHYEALDVADKKGIYTKFVFHFPQWWKPRKTLKLRWVCDGGTPNDGPLHWVQTKAIHDMRGRLIYHFQTRKYV